MKKKMFLLGLPLALLIFCGVFWWNFPWEGALNRGLTLAETEAGGRGVTLSCGTRTVQDHVNPLFRCGDLRVHHALGNLELVRVEARLHPVRSLLNRGVTLQVAFGPGQLVTLTGQKLAWVRGTCSLVVGPKTLLLTDLDMTGDLAAKGFLEVSLEKGRISRAAVDLKTPAETESMLQTMTAFLPLKRVKAGEWRLERK